MFGKQKVDFYLNKERIVVECQGIQHFKPVAFSSKMDAEGNFHKIRELDKLKQKIARDNNIPIIYYTDLNYNNFLGEPVLSDLNKVLEKILSYSS